MKFNVITPSKSLPPNKYAHLEFLDVIRGAAILLVFWYHALGASFGHYELEWRGAFRSFDVDGLFLLFLPLTYGFAGVPIFFVVSGFCIHLSHLRSTRSGLIDFFIRRVFRIYPPYILALGIFIFVPPWRESTHSLGMVWFHILNIHNFSPHYFHGINGSFWSVAVEFQLYIIYPLLLILVRRFGWRGFLLVAGAIEVGLRLVLAIRGFANAPSLVPHPSWLFFSPFAFWFSWSIGAHVAERWHKGELATFPRTWLLPLLLLALISNFFVASAPFGFLLWSLWTALWISQALVGTATGRSTGFKGWFFRHLASLGAVSFSFYLLHQPIANLAPIISRRLLPEYSGAGVAMVVCAAIYWAVFGLSKLFYRFCERPAIDLGQRVIRRINP